MSDSNIDKNKSVNLKELLFGLVILAIMTYATYGIAAGIQNRLSQNPLLIAVLFGMFLGNLFTLPKTLQPAIDFTIKYLIKAGVILVGLRISIQVIHSMGYGPVIVAVSELVTIFLLSYFFLSKVVRYNGKLPILLAAGCAICGAAAILSVAMVVQGKQRVVTLSITMVTLMGTLQLFAYPYLYSWGYMEHFNDQLFGIFAGVSIYEIAQVYGAGYAVSDTAINYATLVKLIKVMMLVPMIFLVGYIYSRKEQAQKFNLPWFILFFVGMVVINSTFTLNGTVKVLVSQTGAFLFLMAMLALGLKTNLKSILETHDIKKLLFTGVFIIILTTLVAYFYTFWTMSYFGQTSVKETEQQNEIKTATLEKYYDGKTIFRTIGCDKCHVESLPTKSGDSLVLYSDLLIHDMGPALDDKITQGLAIGTDWRTTPLAGIGNRKRFLHDGRATTFRDAIIAHDGESKIVRDRFIDLREEDKLKIYQFLATLK